MDISFDRWLMHYVPQLEAAGVGTGDAREAALIGWNISYAHQSCFGDDGTPINFSADPRPHPKLMGLVACAPSQQRNGMPDSYTVFALGIADRVSRAWQIAGEARERHTVCLGLAVHEVRHRIQAREPAVKQFRRDQVFGQPWTDSQALVVASFMKEQYRTDEQYMREEGMDDHLVSWVFSNTEFDADVVERLFLHRTDTVQTSEELAAFIRMPAPIMSR